MSHTFHMTDTIGDFMISTLANEETGYYETAGFRIIHGECGEKSRLTEKKVFGTTESINAAIQIHDDAIDFIMRHGRLPVRVRERMWECFDTMLPSEYPKMGDWFETGCWSGRVTDVSESQEDCSYVVYIAVYD